MTHHQYPGVASVAVRVDGTWRTPSCVQVKHSWTAPGGCGEASFVIVGDELAGFIDTGCVARISHRVTGECLWSGAVFAVDGTEVDGVPSLAVTCEGSSALMSDREYRLPYLSTNPSLWVKSELMPSVWDSTVQGTDLPWITQGPQSIVLTIPPERDVQTGDVVQARFVGYDNMPALEGFQVGGFAGQNQSAISSTNYVSRMIVGHPVSDAHLVYWRELGTTSFTVEVAAGLGAFPRGRNILTMDIQLHNGGPLKPPFPRWTAWHGWRVYAQMYTRHAAYTTTNPSNGIDPCDVVEDLIGRYLSDIISRDEARTPNYRRYGTVARYNLWSLDYQDPVQPADVLDDLCQFNPDFTWMLGPADATDGLHGLEFTDWGREPRFVVPDTVAWSVSGDDALYNRVTVAYKHRNGSSRTVTRTGTYETYPELEALRLPSGWFRTREYPLVTLGEAVSTQVHAEWVAQVVLDAVARRPRGGTVQVTAPVLDMATGRVLEPEQIRPGVRAKVAGTPHVLRVTKVDVDDDKGEATLTLSNPRLSMEQLIARGTRGRPTRWRY